MLLSPWFKALLRGRNRRLRKQAARRKHQHHRNVAGQMELLETRTMLSATYAMVDLDATNTTNPGENAIAAAIDTNVEITYEQTIDDTPAVTQDDYVVHSRYSGQLIDDASTTSTDENEVTVTSQTISMNPEDYNDRFGFKYADETDPSFFAGETVQITVTSDIEDSNGDPAQSYVWEFTTGVKDSQGTWSTAATGTGSFT